MKKIVPLILIFIFVLSGFLVPISASAATPPDTTPPASCGGFVEVITNPGDCIMLGMVNGILETVSYTLWMSGTLLNHSIDFSLDLVSFLDKTPGIELAWGTFRDLANIFFIFILLYISIATILQLEQYSAKQLLVKVILIALLMNFSLFVTKVVIDTSNILATQFYSSIAPGGSSGDNGLSNEFVKGLKLTTIYTAGSDVSSGGKATSGSLELGDSLTLILFASIFILITAFVFFAAAIMFTIRTAVLAFLMVLSPLAFASMVLPGTRGMAKKWWGELLNQSFFAPIYLALTWVVLKVIESGGTKGGTFADALAGGGSVDIIFNFMLLSALMIASLNVAKSMGAHGSATMIKWGDSSRKWAQGAAGRNTIGRGASAIANSDAMKRFTAKNPRVGNFALKPLDNIGGASFGGAKGGYDKARKDAVKQKVATGKRIATGKLGESLLVKDSNGNLISTKEKYTQELERQRTIKKAYKGEGYKQSRVDREAAQELRTKPTNIQKLAAAIQNQQPTPPPVPPASTPSG